MGASAHRCYHSEYEDILYPFRRLKNPDGRTNEDPNQGEDEHSSRCVHVLREAAPKGTTSSSTLVAEPEIDQTIIHLRGLLFGRMPCLKIVYRKTFDIAIFFA